MKRFASGVAGWTGAGTEETGGAPSRPETRTETERRTELRLVSTTSVVRQFSTSNMVGELGVA